MKKTFLFFALLAITTSAMTQVKVVNSNLGVGTNTPTQKLHVLGNSYFNGNVGINTVPNSNYFMDVNGDVRFSKWWSEHYSFKIDWTGNYYQAVIYPNVEYNLQLGKSDKKINDIYSHNIWLMAQPHVTSDERTKENISRLSLPIEKIKRISGYYYNLKRDILPENMPEKAITDYTRVQIGFLAQELEKEFPELVTKPDSTVQYYSVNYGGMIPVLLEAIKEQQFQIEKQQIQIEDQQNVISLLQNIVSYQELDLLELKKMQNDIKELQQVVAHCCDNPNVLPIEEPYSTQEKAILYQNIPNPFSSNTEIICNLPEATKQAVIYIYNLQGVELKAYSLVQTGRNRVIVHGSELPAGMYLYTLVVDNQILDTKRMILTK